MEQALTYLQPEVVSKLANMELRARMVVEGFITGMHKSPYHGFSVEFAEHRQYMPGDEIRSIDWKVYGKTDRYYIKQYRRRDKSQIVHHPRCQCVHVVCFREFEKGGGKKDFKIGICLIYSCRAFLPHGAAAGCRRLDGVR